ncbi:MAG: EamA family transporter [Chitinophagaceae bacterium]|nr:EamA family transporter [Chitinophagaceae bacterium]
MKNNSFAFALILALVAAVGNALFALGQKKATVHANPFLYGSFTLLAGGVLLSIVSVFFNMKGVGNYAGINFKWFLVSGSGYVLLNIGLYFLYRNYGASYYTLYAVLSIITTSVLLATLVFNEKLNWYYGIAFLFALLTIIFFMLGKTKNT